MIIKLILDREKGNDARIPGMKWFGMEEVNCPSEAGIEMNQCGSLRMSAVGDMLERIL